eukprot:TRINITY_DN4583_c0_g1_i5.p1 TRINITY_DN4583_c0_g1~~TRINITY_DN4583_c0_g1_i5.p1  ORF type:complete len:189 (+),score=28.04 TRINITY_DN4583_c0_g1_i5:25-567(+)
MTSLRALVYAVCWGANDSALSHSSQHVPLSEYQSNLDLIVRTLQATQPEGDDPHRAPFVLLLTPPPVIETRWEVELRGKVPPRKLDRCLEITQQYAATAMMVGDRLGVSTINVFDLFMSQSSLEDLLWDGLHLSIHGNRLVLEAVQAAMKAFGPRELQEGRLRRGMALLCFFLDFIRCSA